jgi:voltage-gated sodium channel
MKAFTPRRRPAAVRDEQATHAGPPCHRIGPAPAVVGQGVRRRLGVWLEGQRVQWAVMAVILANAVILGIQTTRWGTGQAAAVLGVLDSLCLAVFVVELGLKLYAHGLGFFRSGWNVFDLGVVTIALLPAAGAFAVLRALRVLRVLRLVSAVPRMRFVVEALVGAIPGLASIGALLSLVFYVGAVMATALFGESHPQWFGSIGASAYSLFQIMTLESWSMGIVRPVMEIHPWAWAFFVPFILVAAFTVLNLFMAVIVDSMQTLRHNPESWPEPPPEDLAVMETQQEIVRLQIQVSALQSDLTDALRLLRNQRNANETEEYP